MDNKSYSLIGKVWVEKKVKGNGVSYKVQGKFKQSKGIGQSTFILTPVFLERFSILKEMGNGR